MVRRGTVFVREVTPAGSVISVRTDTGDSPASLAQVCKLFLYYLSHGMNENEYELDVCRVIFHSANLVIFRIYNRMRVEIYKN